MRVPTSRASCVSALTTFISLPIFLLNKLLGALKMDGAGEVEDRREIMNTNDVGSFRYVFPMISLLNKNQKSEVNTEELKDKAIKLCQTFQVFGIKMDIVDISYSPRFTRFEIQIGKNVRIRDIFKIKDDIKLNLETNNLNIEAPIPGRTTIGIDIENRNLSTIKIRSIIQSKEFMDSTSNLTVTIGKDMAGNVIVENLENVHHLLIGGTIGSGKSVFINSIIMSILYKANPTDSKLILIDTKAINFCIYNDIPHLMVPVITDIKKASAALNWCVSEMKYRYQKFSDFGARDLKSYNKSVEKFSTVENPIYKFPRIVIIIDDFSDLMASYSGKIEESICRLAQMGRACGIHLIISTQRPSVDVITGTIKANIPTRIAFKVFSAVDSRTILDSKGAEELLGDGDMLFYPQGHRNPIRVQGAFVSDEEIENVVNFVKNQMIGNYVDKNVENTIYSKPVHEENYRDEYFVEAGKFVIEKDKASIGMIQRVFKIGFNRAARIIDQLEEADVVGKEIGTAPREVLMTMEEFERYIEKYL